MGSSGHRVSKYNSLMQRPKDNLRYLMCQTLAEWGIDGLAVGFIILYPTFQSVLDWLRCVHKTTIQIHITCTLNFLCVIFVNKLLVNEKSLITSYCLTKHKMCTIHKRAKTIPQYIMNTQKKNLKRGLEYIRLIVIWSHTLLY